MAVDLAQFASPNTRRAPAAPSGPVDLARFAIAGHAEPPPVERTIGEEFQRGVGTGINQLQSSLWGLADIAASSLGSRQLSDLAREGVAANQLDAELLSGSVPGFTDIETGEDFFRWAASSLGQNIPTLAMTMTGGGIGAAVARRTLAGSIRKGVMRAAREEMERTGRRIQPTEITQALRKALQRPEVGQMMHRATLQGAAAGAAAPSFGMQAGEVQNELVGAGINAPGTAVVAGAVGAGLEALPVARLVERFFPNVDRQLANRFVTDVARAMGMQAALEGSTEAAQEVVALAARAYHDPSFEITSTANRERVIDALAAGALVGGLSGGASEAIMQAPDRARSFARRELDFTRHREWVRDFGQRIREARAEGQQAAAAPAATSAVPTIPELREAVAQIFEEQVSPAVGAVRQQINSALDNVRAQFAAGHEDGKLAGLADAIDETLRARAQPELDEATRLINTELADIEAQAATMEGPERGAFLNERIDQMRQRIADFVQQRIQPLVQQTEQQAAREIETHDYDDDLDDDIGDPNDPGTGDFPSFGDMLERASSNPEELTRAAVGGLVEKSRTVRGRTQSVRGRSLGEQAEPMPREQAEELVAKVRPFFPDMSETAIDVEAKDEGFVVALRDIGNAEAIFEVMRLLDALDQSRLSTRFTDRRKTKRQLRIVTPDGKPMMVDVPTLAEAGADIRERGDVSRDEQRPVRLAEGLATTVGRLLEAGYQIDPTALNEATVLQVGQQEVSFADAQRQRGSRRERDDDRARARLTQLRGRTDLSRDEISELGGLEALVANMQEDRARDELTREQRDVRMERTEEVGEAPRAETVFDQGGSGLDPNIDTSSIPSEEQRNRESRAARVAPAFNTKESLQEWTRDTSQQRIGLLSIRKGNVAERVGEFVREMAELAGLEGRIIVVDAQGARALADSGYPLADHLTKAVTDDPAGRVLIGGPDTVIYLSERLWSNKDLSPAQRAGNVFAVLSHEIGHVVEAAQYRRLPDRLKQQIRKAWEDSGSAKPFEEWMADQFVGWASRARAPRNAVEQFFQSVVAQLRRIWDTLRGKYPLDRTFEAFMNGIVAANRGVVNNEFAAFFHHQGVAARAEFALPVVHDHTAFHGSPHRFTRFSLDFMGSGEGAQAFGWGLYFAENRKVAESYRDTLAEDDSWTPVGIDNPNPADKRAAETLALEMQSGLSLEEAYAKRIESTQSFIQRTHAQLQIDWGKVETALRNWRRAGVAVKNNGTPDTDMRTPEERQAAETMKNVAWMAVRDDEGELVQLDVYNKAINLVSGEEQMLRSSLESAEEELASLQKMQRAGATIEQVSGGALYRVDIPDAAVANFLDRDAPIEEQPEAVQRAFAEAGIDGTNNLIVELLGDMYTVVDGSTGEPVKQVDPMTGALERVEYLYEDLAQEYISSQSDGAGMYNRLSAKLGGDQQASEFLAARGVPGLKFFDAFSRNGDGSEGSRNLVVFDDHIIQITEVDDRPFTAEDIFEHDFDEPLPFAQRRLAVRVRQIMRNYPRTTRGAEQVWRSARWLHDQLFASLQGTLRRMPFSAAGELADMMDRVPGKARANQTYFNAVDLARARFMDRFTGILKGMNEKEKAEALAELVRLNGRKGRYKNAHAREISKVFREMHDYMIERGLPVKKVENYFHRAWDPEKVRAGYDDIMERLRQLGADDDTAKNIVDTLASLDDEMPFRVVDEDKIYIPDEGFRERRNQFLNDEFFDRFQLDDLEHTIANYVNSAVKRAEFNAFLGQDHRVYQENLAKIRTMRDEAIAAGDRDREMAALVAFEQLGAWSPTKRFDELIKSAREAGATQAQLKYMHDAVDAMLGRYGRDLPQPARETMAWIMTYQNMRILLFSALSSLPDVVGPAIRSNDVRGTWRTLRSNLAQIVNGDSDINEIGRTWGIITDTLQNHILTEHFDNHWFPPQARAINEKFFRYTGLEKWTNMTRAAALAVGIDFIKRRAVAAKDGDQRAIEDLAELGLTHSDVTSWVRRGEKVYGRAGVNAQADRKIAEAMQQFVHESVMRPNPSQRPLWASNPAFMLLFHMKSFMYSFHATITRQLVRNFQRADTPWQKAYVVALPGIMMMALTGLGLELRELLQYRLWGDEGRTDRMDGLEYVTELFQRSGLLGPSQLAVDWEGADERGQLPLAAVSGPALNQLADWVSDPLSQTVPKAIPGIAQIPALRQAVRDVVPGL